MIRVETLSPQMILVPEGRGPLDEGVVASLVDSIAKTGLLNPITVWRPSGTTPYLIAGHHRLEAVRRLRHDTIRCVVLSDHEATSEVDARLAEVAENLHRREITAAERADLIVSYADIVREREAQIQVAQPDPPEVGYRKPPPQKQGIASRVAADLGLGKATVNRALARSRAPASVEAPPPPSAPVSTEPRDLLALRRAWANACAESRERFLAEVQSTPNEG